MKRFSFFVLIAIAVAATNGQSAENATVTDDENQVTNATAKEIPIPEPVNVSHGFKMEDGAVRGPRIEMDFDGVPIVHGVVMPDDPTDTQIWRNARVLNNKLIEKPAAASSTSPVVAEEARHENDQDGGMFVYRPQMARILDGENTRDFKPSQSDPSLTSSLPYPSYYYQDYYRGKDDKQPQLPDTLAVESQSPTHSDDAATSQHVVISDVSDSELQDDSSSDVSATAATIDDTDGRGFNTKKKNTGFHKKTPGSSYSDNYYATGRPITYYVQSEEAKSIHDDRSPYDYEPAQQTPQYYANDAHTDQQHTQYQYYNQQQPQQQQQQQKQSTPERSGYYQQNGYLSSGNVVPAPNDQFIIRDQTYHNGGGQAFSVPVPVPKDQYVQQQYPYQYQYAYQQPGSQQNYYYNQQQQQQQPSVQPFDFIGLKFKEQVQKAKDKFHDMTDPVVDPLMEAGQKISTNLGLPERVHKINEKVATPSVLVPLAMAAGGVLALGGLSTAIALGRDDRLKFNETLKSLGLRTSPLAERITTLLEKNKPSEIIKVKRSVDDYYDEEKENLLDRVLSSLNAPQKAFLGQLQQTGFDQWQRTSCAKRIFCDVMVQQNDDTITFMEKRMGTFLTLLDSGMAQNLQALTDDVMDGIRRRNCAAFVCAKQSGTGAAASE